MIELIPQHDDDPSFLDLVRRNIEGTTAACHPREVYVVHIDNWFGDRWVHFSGKLFGMAGVRMKRLTVPPFHPRRVRSEQHYKKDEDADEYRRTENHRRLHRYQESSQNLRRFVTTFGSSTMFVWYSGNSLANGAGSLMVYAVQGAETEWWYVSFERTSEWFIKKCVGISAERVTMG